MTDTPSQADLDKNEIFAATMRETRETLDRWSDEKVKVLGGWMVKSLCIALTMLLAVYIVSLLASGIDTYALPNILGQPHMSDVVIVFLRNMLVLALHGF